MEMSLSYALSFKGHRNNCSCILSCVSKCRGCKGLLEIVALWMQAPCAVELYHSRM